MNKIILTLMLSVLIIPAISFGENSIESNQKKINAVKQQRETLMNKIKLNKENKQNEQALKIQDAKKQKTEALNKIEQRIGKKLDEKRTVIANKFEQAIKNLQELVVRVENKMTIMEVKGVNSTSTIELLVVAKENIVLAEAELTILEDRLAETISTSTKKDYIEEVKIQNDKTKDTIKLTHKSIIDVIQSLKPGLLKERSENTKASTSTNEQ